VDREIRNMIMQINAGNPLSFAAPSEERQYRPERLLSNGG
jgi:hypothetical protein